MAELEAIAEALQRQRKALEILIDETSSRSGETVALVGRIEDLKRRSEDTRRRFEASLRESNPNTTKR